MTLDLENIADSGGPPESPRELMVIVDANFSAIKAAVDANSNKNSFPPGASTKVAFITVTGDVDLDAMVTAIASKMPIVDPILTNPSYTKQDLGTLTGGTQDINWANGNYVIFTISTATQTLTFSNWRSLGASGGILEITNGASQMISLPSGSEFAGGEEIVLTAGKDLVGVITSDGGTTPIFFVGPQDIK